MFLKGEEEALEIYRRYRHRKKEFGKILEAFLALRQAGYEPPLMGEIEKWRLDAAEVVRKSHEAANPAVTLEETREQEDPTETAPALPPDIVAGDRLAARLLLSPGRPKKSLGGCRRRNHVLATRATWPDPALETGAPR
jgi:hypothetical protein